MVAVMIRINRETDYSVLILSLMAADSSRRYSASMISAERGLPQPVVSKILKHLVREGVLVSYRGAKGGYGLARPPETITIADIVAAMEGPISLTHCTDEGPSACQYHDGCVASSNWRRINQAVHQALDGISLKDMITPLPGGAAREAYVPLTALSR
jgi:FeS assembly SUF system regulator